MSKSCTYPTAMVIHFVMTAINASIGFTMTGHEAPIAVRHPAMTSMLIHTDFHTAPPHLM